MEAMKRFDVVRAITLRATAQSPRARNGLEFPRVKA